MISQPQFLIRIMADFKKEINLEEERKDVPNTTFPHEIYTTDYQMVNFPAQPSQSIKKFEEKINTICEYIEICQQV